MDAAHLFFLPTMLFYTLKVVAISPYYSYSQINKFQGNPVPQWSFPFLSVGKGARCDHSITLEVPIVSEGIDASWVSLLV